MAQGGSKTALFSRKTPGGVFSIYDEEKTTGNIFFVDSGSATGSDAVGYGDNPDRPFATIDYAIGQCTANNGDRIIVMAGHAETLTVAITCDVAGVSIIGLAVGTNRPQLTINANIDGITVTAANVRISGLYFNEGSAAHTASINVAAANCIIEDCHFDCGANDLESITVTADGDDLLVRNCSCKVTANGPDAWIEVEGTSFGLRVEDCYLDGGSATNAWDSGALNSGQAHTVCRIKNVTTTYGPGIIFSGAATGVIEGCHMVGGTLGSMLDPGSCLCVDNWEQDAIDEAGIMSPRTVNPDGIGDGFLAADSIGSNAIAAAKIAADAITNAKIADNAISEEQIDADAAAKVTTGVLVEKAAANLPQTTAAAIFTVATGRVAILGIVGEVTTIIQTQANNTKLTANPTTGTSADICAALDISADEVGALYGITGTFTDALQGGTAGATVLPDRPVVVNVGTIDLDCAASNTGQIKWQLWYVPLDTGATVTAA